jgi:hypothetical protein
MSHNIICWEEEDMKKIVKIGTIMALATLLVLPAIGAQTQDMATEVKLMIRGGLGYTFMVNNFGNTTVIAAYSVKTLSGNLLDSGNFSVTPGWGYGRGSVTSGFGWIVASLSVGDQSISRTGLVLGMFVIFVTPPFF